MNPLPVIAIGLTAVGAAAGAAAWYKRRTQAGQTTDPERFVLEVAEGQWADMEAASQALETSKSAEVHFFAQLLLDNNRALNNHLQTLAQKHDLQLVDKADLASILKEKMLALRSAQAFDKAYATQQHEAHEKRIELYRQGTRLKNIDLANFARKGLEQMQEHQRMSRALVAHLEQAEAHPAGSVGRQPAPQNSSMTQVTGSAAHLGKGVPQQIRGGATNPGH